MQIWKIKFGHKVFVQTLSTRFRGLVKILKLMLRQDFEDDVLVNILFLMLGCGYEI